MLNRHFMVPGALFFTLVLIWTVRLMPWDYTSTIQSAKDSMSTIGSGITGGGGSSGGSSSSGGSGGSGGAQDKESEEPLPMHVQAYFDQVFGLEEPTVPYGFEALRDACARADWDTNEAYLSCGGMSAGMTSIVSQIKVCFKMAVDTGSHLVLPTMPLRDSEDLRNFNFLNGSAYMAYDKWFDAGHLRRQMAAACPRMKIVHPAELDVTVPVKRRWSVACADAPGYRMVHSYFWVGRPYKTFFNEQMQRRQDEENLAVLGDPAAAEALRQKEGGITVVDVDSKFLLYRITDDPTRRDLRLWNDLSHLVRFLEPQRRIIARLLARMAQPDHDDGYYYGVHFRVEKDSLWSSLEHQLGVDLDALDRAWETFGRKNALGFPDTPKPPVYLACGDVEQVDKFVEAGAARGWNVTHKWRLAQEAHDDETMALINSLPFDFQGAVDMGLMVRSRFFLGLQGSAFSSTVANQRDITGRYRGSSFEVGDDERAHTHLFNDMDAGEYACCL